MVLQDEIRGRLAEVFSLKSYKIDHVVHGAIASICSYGALIGATAEQIESAIGMFVAHYIHSELSELVNNYQTVKELLLLSVLKPLLAALKELWLDSLVQKISSEILKLFSD